ncbi:MAG: ferritin-like domain-containing protein [Candidatus Dormibacteraceae bacterium]
MNQDSIRGRSVIQFAHEKDRRAFLKYAALVGVGGSLAGALPISNVFADASPTPTPSGSPSTAAGGTASGTSQFGAGDIGILNYALTLEYLESEFYQKGLAANILGDDAKYVTPVAAHEAAHVAAITATLTKLGATPATKPTFVFPPTTFTDKATFLKTAVTFEETGVKAYQGQVTLIKDGAILGAAASIAGVESRHAAVLNYLAQTPPVPNPVEQHATADETLAAVKPFLGA